MDEGEPIVTHLIKKYGPHVAQSFHDPNSNLRQMGRKVNIEFNDNRLMVNTKRAHALMEQFKNKGENDLANNFMLDLYQSYFERAQNINDELWLKQKVINDYNMDETEATFAMNDINISKINHLDQQIKAKYGVNGVPFYMIFPNNNNNKNTKISDNDNHGSDDGPITFSGAYPPEVIAEQLKKAAGI